VLNDSEARPLDLHALSTPPAFILSQDQTLKKNIYSKKNIWSSIPAPILLSNWRYL